MNPADRAHYAEVLEREGEIRDFTCQLRGVSGISKWVSLTARKICGADGKTQYYQGFMQDLTAHMLLEDRLQTKIRELQLLSEINSAMLRAESEQELLEECCRIIVERGGYRMAWVGFAEDGPVKRVKPVAHFGYEDGYLKVVTLTWDETELGRGPTGMAIRTEAIQCSHEIATDPNLKAWRTEAAERGYCSSIALPFRVSEDQMACLTAYADKPNNWSQSEKDLMQDVAEDLGFGLKGLRTEVAKNQYQQDLRATLLETIEVIAETVDQRDPYTAGHQHRVADLCCLIANKLGLSEDRTLGLELAAMIHDLGKIGVPIELLTKPGRLSLAQLNVIKEHAQIGYDIIKNVHFPWPIADIVHQHHERLDGSGHPLGLKAEDILLEAKILGVADVVEAMGTDRPYRKAHGIEVALQEITSKRDILYDPAVADACVELFHKDGYTLPSTAS